MSADSRRTVCGLPVTLAMRIRGGSSVEVCARNRAPTACSVRRPTSVEAWYASQPSTRWCAGTDPVENRASTLPVSAPADMDTMVDAGV
ncbi:hypothetical protein IOD13_03865 [Brevibacterium casei]|nr:hypothetical protein [Brevibacterium casei]